MINIIPGVLLGAKTLLLIGIGLYVGFSFVLVRQEQLMKHVLEETFEPIIRVLVLAHAAAAILLFFFGFILL